MNKSGHTFFKTACGVFGGKPELLCLCICFAWCFMEFSVFALKKGISNAVQAEH